MYVTRMARPDWWDWELELTPHLEKRMEDRDFTELDLRSMLQRARSHHPDHVEGRYVIPATHRGRMWRVIVEPDESDSLLVVITCYPVGEDQ
jgi:hypothetical protein